MKIKILAFGMMMGTGLAVASFSIPVFAKKAPPKLTPVAPPSITVTSITADEQGMPHCLSLSDGDGIVLKWDRDEYQRDIFAARLSQLARANQSTSGNQPAPGNPPVKATCANYKSFEGSLNVKSEKTLKWTVGSAELDKVTLASPVIVALTQVVRGANQFHAETTGAEYLAAHPLALFTREINRELAAEFGVGFTGEIYRAFLAGRPEYKAFQERITAHLASSESVSLGTRAAGTTVLLANGFMQGIADYRLKPMETELRAQGLDVVVLTMDSVGSLQTNVDLLKTQIVAQAARSPHLIVMAGSKGVPELLAAIVELSESNPAVVGQIQAMVNLCGMIEGSFALDWGMKLPQRIFVEKEMKKQAKLKGLEMTNSDGLRDMTTKNLAEFVPSLLPRLPHSIKYFNVVGIPGGNGLVREKSIATLQTAVTRKRVGLHGANDGYIEFPGTEIPNTLGLSLYTVTFDASHALLDGWYEGHDLQNEEEMKNVMKALFGAVLDLSN